MATLLEQIEEIDCIHKLYAVDLTMKRQKHLKRR
jgi:hypothetical protein